MSEDANKTSLGAKVILGAEILAAGSALYMLFGPNSKENIDTAKDWAVNMEKDIVAKIDDVKEFTEEKFSEIIEEIKEKYEKMKEIDKKELASTIEDLTNHWISIIKAKKVK